MKKWIREHPWRLEIVPFFMLVFAAIYYIVTEPGEGEFLDLASKRQWLLVVIGRLLIMVSLWYQSMQSNHSHVAYEIKKEFNHEIYFYIGLMWLWGTFPNVLGAMMIPALFLQLLLEKTRPYKRIELPADNEILPRALDVQQGDAFYYREIQVNWNIIVGAIAIILLSLGIVFSHPYYWRIFAIFPIIASGFLILLIRKQPYYVFSISSEYIRIKAGNRTVSLPTKNIKTCTVEGHSPELAPARRIDLDEVWVPANRISSRLKIVTKEYQAYLLGMKRPATACRLIETVITTQNEKRQLRTDLIHTLETTITARRQSEDER